MATIHKPFKYVPAVETDIRQTIKRELARLKALEEERRAAAGSNVKSITPQVVPEQRVASRRHPA
jgi:hypothetical protein